MKLATAVSFAFFSATAAMAAQVEAPASSTVYRLPSASAGCPVSLNAQHLSDGSMIQTDNPHPKGIGQRLQITLTSPDTRQIASATITVRGFSNKSRMIQTGSGEGAFPDAVRTLRVQFNGGEGKNVSAAMWINGLTSVATIELKSVAYKDGSVWKPVDSATCRIAPDPLMLVSNR